MKTYRRTTGIKTGSILAALLLFAALVLLPLLALFADLLTADTTQLATIRARLFDPSLQAAFLRTAAIALLACGLASAVAVPAAMVLMQGQAWLRVSLTLFGVLPLAMPPMLTAAVLQQLGASGWLTAPPWPASYGIGAAELQLVAVYALHYFPLLLLAVAAAQRDALHDATDAARAIGAGRTTILRRLRLPMLFPGYLLGASLMLLRVLEDAATPLMVGIDGMLAPRVLQRLLAPTLDAPATLIDAAVLIAATAFVVLLTWRALQRPIAIDGAPRPSRASRRYSAAATTLRLVASGMAFALVLLPYAGLALIAADATTAPHGVAIDSTTGTTVSASVKTLVFALFAGLLIMPASALLGTLVAAPCWMARWLRGSVTAVLALPSMVLGFAFLHWIRTDADATLPVNAAWSILSLIVALKLLPLGQFLIATRWRSLDPDLNAAARALGSAAPRFGTIAIGALLPLVLLMFVLATLGTLTEVNTALALLKHPDVPLIVELYQAVGADTGWPMPALLLTLCVLGMLASGVVLWHITCSHRRKTRGRFREGLQTS